MLLFANYFSWCRSSLHYLARPFIVAPGIADFCLAPGFCCNFHDWWESLWFNCLILEFGVRVAFCNQYHSLNGAELEGSFQGGEDWGGVGYISIYSYTDSIVRLLTRDC
jgi:hypothetical protein